MSYSHSALKQLLSRLDGAPIQLADGPVRLLWHMGIVSGPVAARLQQSASDWEKKTK